MDISRAKRAGVLAALLWAFLLAPARAVPPGFNIQGRLTNANGVNREGNYSIKFTLYDAATAGTTLWTRTYSALTVRNGNFQTVLGDVAGQPMLSDVFATGDSRYLEIQVLSGPGVSSPEVPLVPRQQLASVPYAMQAANASSAAALTSPVTIPVSNGMNVNGLVNAAGYLMNSNPLAKIYVAFFNFTGGSGSASINLNTGGVTNGTLTFLNGEKFPAGTKAIGMAFLSGYEVGFCQQGNGEYVLLNGSKIATINNVAQNITFTENIFGCAGGTSGGGAIFVGE